jgi:hypothetical protein
VQVLRQLRGGALWLLNAVVQAIVSILFVAYFTQIQQWVLGTNPLLAIGSITALVVISGITAYRIAIWVNKRPKKEATVNVYPREHLYLSEFLLKAKSKVDIFGITLEDTIRGHQDTIKNVLRKPELKQCRVLICNPNSPIIGKIEDLVATNVETIRSTLNSLNDLHNSTDLSLDQKNKIAVKLFNGIPVQSLFIIDSDKKGGAIRLEPYLFGITKQDRRISHISKKKQRHLFDTYSRSFDEMWNEAIETELNPSMQRDYDKI